MDAAAIAALVPHAGAMSLLDGVVDCTPDAIECTARQPLHPDNPLLERGRLHAMALLEYGAQAAAVHAAMAGGGTQPAWAGQRAAYLAAIRDLSVAGVWLGPDAEALQVTARCITSGTGGAIYGIEVAAQGVSWLTARITLAQSS